MARFSIELRTDDQVSATLVLERDDHNALRIHLASFVGDLLKNHAGLIWEDQEWRIDVTVERGLILYVMNISATDLRPRQS